MLSDGDITSRTTLRAIKVIWFLLSKEMDTALGCPR
jgi:hypothetical protein